MIRSFWYAYECLACGMQNGCCIDVRLDAEADGTRRPPQKMACPCCGADMHFGGSWKADDSGYGSRSGEPTGIDELTAARAVVPLARDNAQLTLQLSHVQARCTEMLEEIRLLDRRSRVERFFEIACQRVPIRFGDVAEDELRLGLRLVVSECFELIRACVNDPVRIDEAEGFAMKAIGWAPLQLQHVDAVDALEDIDYTVEGMRIRLGLSRASTLAIAAAVHGANMRKKDGPVVDGKKMKPADWVGPEDQIRQELAANGWRPPEG